MISHDDITRNSTVDQINQLLDEKLQVLMNIEECSKFLGLSKNSLYIMTSKKEIPFYKVGKRILFDKGEVYQWITTNFRIKTTKEISQEAKTDYHSKYSRRKDKK